MIEKKKWIIPLLFGIAFVVPFPVVQQIDAQLDKTKADRIRSTSVTIRSPGWQIPKHHRSRDKISSSQIDGVTVSSRTLTPLNSIVDYEDYFVYSNNEISIIPGKRKIVSMSEYSAKGKIFAYAISYTPYFGEDERVAGVLDSFFFDNDGDGLFEERSHSANLLKVPEWIKLLK